MAGYLESQNDIKVGDKVIVTFVGDLEESKITVEKIELVPSTEDDIFGSLCENWLYINGREVGWHGGYVQLWQ